MTLRAYLRHLVRRRIIQISQSAWSWFPHFTFMTLADGGLNATPRRSLGYTYPSIDTTSEGLICKIRALSYEGASTLRPARKAAGAGGNAYDDMLARLRLKQAY